MVGNASLSSVVKTGPVRIVSRRLSLRNSDAVLGDPRQHELCDDSGRLLARTDFWWEDFRHVGEFDGKIKYGRLLKPGQDPGDVVFEEKRREDMVRELTGYGCGRLVWRDLSNPKQTGERFRRLLG